MHTATTIRSLLALTALVVSGFACGGEPRVCADAAMDLVRPEALTVTTSAGHEPFAFRRDGELTGFEVELLREVARFMGLEPRFRDRTSSTLVPDLLTRRTDVVAAALVPTDELRTQTCLTDPILDGGVAVVAHADRAEEISEAGPFADRLLAVARDSAEARWVQDNAAGSTVSQVATVTDVADAVVAGSVDVGVLPRPVALWRRTVTPELRVIEEAETGESYVLAVHPDAGRLRRTLDDALRTLREAGTYDKVSESFLGPRSN